MKEIGLHPTDTSEPGGKETGQSMPRKKIDAREKGPTEAGHGLPRNGQLG
jgi:hypothetical protein